LSLLLFDIDGTLLLSGGAGVRAMTRAFEAVFGVHDAFATADIAGRTDTYILSHALRRAGLPDTPENHERFRHTYIPVLEKEIQRPSASRRGLMPGVRALLDEVKHQQQFYLALLTGNFERAAYIKLDHFGIAPFFEWGAFGEESSQREDLARAAARRAQEREVPPLARERAIVIGDTPHDVACARVIGARCLAVATGNYDVGALTAAGADIVLADLSDTSGVLELLK
jgi:phosphoglycolate phosphatase-like HAD superfamily hydrolase